MTDLTVSNVVYLNANNQPMTDSVKLAAAFGLIHKNVLQKIDNILAETPDYFRELNFQLATHEVAQDGRGTQHHKCYELTRDGFMHIALTFTGKKGNAFRVAIIERFNELERSAPRIHMELTVEGLLSAIGIKLLAEQTRANRAEFKLARFESLVLGIEAMPVSYRTTSPTACPSLPRLESSVGQFWDREGSCLPPFLFEQGSLRTV